MSKEKGDTSEFNAKINRVEGLSGLKVSDFLEFTPGTTPGNVGVCLSGGGSRAMTAGMGQLRGLKTLKTADGKNLLEQTRAVSTVSGGSWLGVTFEYLKNGNVSDDDFLDAYTAPASLTAESIKQLSEKAIGYRCTKDFSVLDLLLELVWIAIFDRVPSHMYWQTLIGIHIMEYYKLFTSDSSHRPDSFFTFDSTTLREIVESNEALADETAHTIASGKSRVRRPFQVCNMSMFVETPGTDFQYLVPVQATPFFTGIVSTPPEAKDFNGSPVGGGGVTSFAFNSQPVEAGPGEEVKVTQQRQWALVDIVGTSSATFAANLQNLARGFVDNPKKLLQEAGTKARHPLAALEKVKPFITDKKPGILQDILGKTGVLTITGKIEEDLHKVEDFFDKAGLSLEEELKAALTDITRGINPLYTYWPPVGFSPGSKVTPTNFADGGNLENLGVNAMLTYSDIHNLISFVNCQTAMENVDFGIFDVEGNPVEGTNIQVDSALPPLFGYQPYNDGKKDHNNRGYRTYKDKNGNFREGVLDPQSRNSQVFAPEQFQRLLKGLWEASGSGSRQHAANFTQTMTTVENAWFGVAGGREIKILWVYNNFTGDWYDKLNPDVQAVVNDTKDFPNYNTYHINLSPTQVNLLSNMTAWNVAEGGKDGVLEMYKD